MAASNPQFDYDSGYQGVIRSLAGVPGTRLMTNQGNIGNLDAVDKLVLQYNPNRLWALIQVPWSATTDAVLYFGSKSHADYGIVVKPGGHVLINKDMPWTGAVSVYLLTYSVRFVEVSVI